MSDLPQPVEAIDTEARVMAQIRTLTGTEADRDDLRRKFYADPVRFVRSLVERYAPTAATTILENIDQLASFAEFRRPTDEVYADLWESGSKGQAAVVRDCRVHNKGVLQAHGLLWTILDRLLTHAVGHPIQAHEVHSTPPVQSPTARELVGLGAEVVGLLRQMLASEAAGRELPPAAVDVDFEVLSEDAPE